MAGAEASMEETGLAFQTGRQAADDAKLLIQFLMYPHHLTDASIEAGRPMYEDREYVKIMVPGDKDNIVFRPVRPQDKQRFAQAYFAFKNNQGEIVQGTPLESWPAITRAMVEEMKFFHIRTVEQLAGMSDTNAQNFRGAVDLRARARTFLDMSKGSAEAEKMAAELKNRDDKISVLEDTVKKLVERLDAAEDKKKK
jgi:hypothetical protein